MIKHLPSYFILSLLLLACSSGPKANLAITNAHIITGTGELLENGTVFIKGDSIVAIGENLSAASADQQIDANGKTVLPGLIETHVHLWTDALPSSESELRNYTNTELTSVLTDFLESGYTTIMSMGDYWPYILEVRDMLDSGELDGPRLLVTGPVLALLKDCHTGLSVETTNFAKIMLQPL